ncbi:MAG: acetolactate synthase large subunit [Desulfomonile tiedjei]|nr:acetolactate synthase large subunit [Desulfomonile tiedjei]
MNGAEILVKTALEAGIEICFSNPGTTELPLVAAMDSMPGIRAVLGLFEGVCTGAADGYGRMSNKPAMTLLHLGPGLGNGLANLHNAKRAFTPVFNVIGEHASWHRAADAPLTMDIEALARTVSGWQCTCDSADSLSKNTADAIAAAMRGQISTLIVPNDFQWTECSDTTISVPQSSSEEIDKAAIDEPAKLLRAGGKALLIVGGKALRKAGLQAAARIRAATGCDLLSERVFARMERGPGIPSVSRLPYFPEHAVAVLSKYEAVVLAGTKEPVAFFGYKGMPSLLLTDSQRTFRMGGGNQDLTEALECLADSLNAPLYSALKTEPSAEAGKTDLPSGPLTADKASLVLARLQPEGAIIVDESITTAATYYPLAANAGPHSLLTITGGAIGQGMPCAVGAALACPDRPVINFQADGSAMYTLQALWTQARESLNITTLICSNRKYNILRLELSRSGYTPPGKNALSLSDLSDPPIDWVKISQGMGVPAVAVDTADRLAKELLKAIAEPGPHLIEMEL